MIFCDFSCAKFQNKNFDCAKKSTFRMSAEITSGLVRAPLSLQGEVITLLDLTHIETRLDEA